MDRPFCTYGLRHCRQQFVICCHCYRYLEAVAVQPTLDYTRIRRHHRLACVQSFLSAPLRVSTTCEPTLDPREGIDIDSRCEPDQASYIARINGTTVL